MQLEVEGLMVSKISCCINKTSGQSSVEAALLLPTLLTVFMLMLQPCTMMYTKIVINFACSDSLRLIAFQGGSQETYGQERLNEYVLHRLKAVPHIDIFHVGKAEGWTIELSASEDGNAQIYLSHKVKPLPLFGGLAEAFGSFDGEYIEVHSDASANLRPSWLQGNYSDWIGMWDE